MSVVNAIPLLLADEGYQISRSVRLRSSASAYFNRTPGSAGNRKTWTFSGWVKRGALSALQEIFEASDGSGNNEAIIQLNANDTLTIYSYIGAYQLNLVTTQVFRDPSAWFHLVLSVDTTQATSADRAKLYINGTQVTSFSTSSYPTQNYDTYVNTTQVHSIGRMRSVSGRYYDGYLTEINFIDGQALTPSSFGETDVLTGVWKPKKYTGTYGTNGFFLNFSDNSSNTATTIGKDYSGNGNNWTPNNISVTSGATYDSMLDVPTLWADGGDGRGNYAVLNPLSGPAVPSTITNGNLTATTASSAFGLTSASMAMPSGKWYCEVKFSSLAIGALIGIRNSAEAPTSYVGGTSGSYGYYSTNGNKYNAGTAGSYGSSYTTSHTIGIAFDADAGSLTFYRDNVSQGVAYSSIPAADWVFAFSDEGTGSVAFDVNFGQRPFAYTPPTGFRALNTQNLPEPTILKGNQYFDVVTYTGNAVQDRSVTGFGFDLDLAWIKSRSNAGSHVLVNRVVGGDKQLFSNLTDAEQTNIDVTNGFTTGGIVLGDNVSGTGSTNQNAYTYAFGGWKEGATPGFDIVTYTGTGSARTVAHSLGVAPKMLIVKRRDAANSWAVWHTSIAANQYLLLDTTGATGTDANIWNNTLPTSSVFSVGVTSNITNANGGTYVAYLFAEVAGFSKFGSYTGNGSTDGPFIFTGFRPAFVMCKRTDGVSNWNMADNRRPAYNAADEMLLANSSSSALTSYPVDLLSNGFKLRTTEGGYNASGSYIYAAFAEFPFRTSLAR